jgi:hypothetical protein
VQTGLLFFCRVEKAEKEGKSFERRKGNAERIIRNQNQSAAAPGKSDPAALFARRSRAQSLNDARTGPAK